MEEWRDVVGYEGLYMVSNEGRVKSLDRVVVDSWGRQYSARGRLLKLILSGQGYLVVGLNSAGDKKQKEVHALVTRCFLGIRPRELCVDHIDRDKKNNALYNLRYATPSENARNSCRSENKKSRYIGVTCGERRRVKWLSQITVNGESVKLGWHADEVSAARAYDAYCITHKLDREINHV